MNATVEEQFDDFLRRIEVAISVARMRADNDSYLCNITIGDVQIMVNEIKWRRYRDDQLRAEVEALRKDAERYRWLKDQDWVTWKPYGLAFKAGAAGRGLDYAVDAHRLTEQHNAALCSEEE